MFIRKLTIPAVSEAEWNRYQAIINPLTIPLFVLLISKEFTISIPISHSFQLPVYAILLVIGFVLALVVFLTSNNYDPPKYFWIFIVVAFFVSCCWLYVVAEEIICLLRALGRIMAISEQIISVTIVAWGNSMVDIVSNLIVAKQGSTGMAMSACFGAPIFNVVCNWG